MTKTYRIFIEALPAVVMIGLIPFVLNDYLLAGLYLVIIAAIVLVRHERLDITAVVLGTLIMTVGEYLFLLTGVETFTRTSLLGVMPLWLPLLWGYGFMAIKRAARILR